MKNLLGLDSAVDQKQRKVFPMLLAKGNSWQLKQVRRIGFESRSTRPYRLHLHSLAFMLVLLACSATTMPAFGALPTGEKGLREYFLVEAPPNWAEFLNRIKVLQGTETRRFDCYPRTAPRTILTTFR